MAIPDGVKIQSAKLVEKTKHAFAFVHYLHPTRSRRDKRKAVVKMKAIATGAINFILKSFSVRVTVFHSNLL